MVAIRAQPASGHQLSDARVVEAHSHSEVMTMAGYWRRRQEDEELGITPEMVSRAHQRDRIHADSGPDVRHAAPPTRSQAEQDALAAKKAFDEQQANRAKAGLDPTNECPELEDVVPYSISDPRAGQMLKQLRLDAEAARHAHGDD